MAIKHLSYRITHKINYPLNCHFSIWTNTVLILTVWISCANTNGEVSSGSLHIHNIDWTCVYFKSHRKNFIWYGSLNSRKPFIIVIIIIIVKEDLWWRQATIICRCLWHSCRDNTGESVFLHNWILSCFFIKSLVWIVTSNSGSTYVLFNYSSAKHKTHIYCIYKADKGGLTANRDIR